MPIQYYVFPNHLEEAKIDFKDTPKMIEFFAKTFGEYPFIKEKYGIAFPFGSPLRESVSGLILTFQEDGRYRYICRRYFDGQ